MYAKVINPKTNGKKVYNNKGTSQRCTNYLAKEAKDAGAEAEFFGAVAAGVLTTAEVIALIDSNVKGLAKETDKFHSLVLSPNAEELADWSCSPCRAEDFPHELMVRLAPPVVPDLLTNSRWNLTLPAHDLLDRQHGQLRVGRKQPIDRGHIVSVHDIVVPARSRFRHGGHQVAIAETQRQKIEGHEILRLSRAR